MWLKVKMLTDWEDLGKIFKKGKVYRAREPELESEFYTDGYYLIPKMYCEVVKTNQRKEVSGCSMEIRR